MQDLVNEFVDTMEAQSGVLPKNLSDIKSGMDNTLIKASNDERGKRTLYVSFKVEGDKASGRWYSCRHGQGGHWHSSERSDWTDEERKAWKEQCDRDSKAHEQKVREQQDKIAEQAREVWKKAKINPSHPYLKKKKILPNGTKCHDDMLLIPLKDPNGNIWNLQTILPDGTKYNSFTVEDNNGKRIWTKGGKKQGCFGSIIKKGVRLDTILICEGFATGASLSEATGFAVAVAVDAGNLKPVARSLQRKYPDAKLIIAADNDQWTIKEPRPKELKDVNAKTIPGDDERWSQWRNDDLLTNPGLEKAKETAAELDISYVYPAFLDSDKGKPTDFNDMHLMSDLDSVKDAVLNEKKPEKVKDNLPAVVDEPKKKKPVDYSGDLPGLPFKILGFNGNKYYYFPFGKQQIVSLSASEHSMKNMMQLARIRQWDEFVGERKATHDYIATIAADRMMEIAETKGVFHERDRVRGCGVWLDATRIVAHCGDHLYVNGEKILPKDMTGKYTYVSSGQALSLEEKPLSDQEAKDLVEVCNLPTWENPMSGDLLAGWLVIAPISAALEWRPHTWVTGEAESGKTTVLNKIIKPCLGDISMNVDGQTTEAAIRNEMGYDARPIIFDEAEGKGKGKNTMEDVLYLARACSSGASIRKYGQGAFVARSCFCFSAINPPVKDFADETRISYFSLRKNTGPNAQQDYYDMLAKVENLIDDKFYLRMFSRTMENMETLLHNIKVFRKVAQTIIKGARPADQVGTMLAGLHLLKTLEPVTEEIAAEVIGDRDWSDHTAINQDTDPARCLHYISTCQVRYPLDGRNVTIGTLISAALGFVDENSILKSQTCHEILKSFSITLSKDKKYVLIGNKDPNLERLLRETDWVFNWNKTLAHLPGAQKQSLAFFGGGNKQRAIKIPRGYFLMDNNEQAEMELDF